MNVLIKKSVCACSVLYCIGRVLFLARLVLLRLIRLVLSAILFPAHCVLCKSALAAEGLCVDCIKKTLDSLDLNRERRCAKCGRSLISEIGICTDCRRESVLEHVDFVFPLYSYGFWAKELLPAWKLGGNRSLSHLFAKLLFTVWETHFNGIPLVPVPPRPGKIRENGWDQIAELTTILHWQYRIPVLKLLVRTEKIEQKKLNRKKRLSGHQFSLSRCAQKMPVAVIPHSVVILDDILTTGATLEKCAAELKGVGVQIVYAFTLFIVE